MPPVLTNAAATRVATLKTRSTPASSRRQPRSDASARRAGPPPLPTCWCRCPTMTKGSATPSCTQTLRARDDLARTLGVAAPRGHAALSSDHRRLRARDRAARGSRPAPLVNGELHLLPLAVLRERGVLERTIRHELVHLMTDAVLGDAPAVGARRRGDLFRRRAADSRRAAAAAGVQARAARLVSERQRAAAPGVGRRAEQRLRARARLLREADCSGKRVAGCAVTRDARAADGRVLSAARRRCG